MEWIIAAAVAFVVFVWPRVRTGPVAILDNVSVIGAKLVASLWLTLTSLAFGSWWDATDKAAIDALKAKAASWAFADVPVPVSELDALRAKVAALEAKQQ